MSTTRAIPHSVSSDAAATEPPAQACYPDGLLSVEAARDFLLARARPLDEVETVDTGAALGRVLAVSQVSAIDVPGHDNSSMDGYALRAADVGRPDPVRLRVTQRIAAGATGAALRPGEAARIFTGAPLPAGADAVAMQEDCRAEDGAVVIAGPVAPGQHVRPRGNDIRAGAEILPAGTRLRPQELGLAASVGLAKLPVWRRARAAVFSSGDELVTPGAALRPGQVYNSNRFTLRALLGAIGCEVHDLGTVADTREATRDALADAAARADVVVSSGGVSVGEEDHVKQALGDVGELEMWRVAVKPGKPLAYGRIGAADFLGLPGNPVSTLVTFCLFVRPFVLRRQGVNDVLPAAFPVRADFRWPRPARRREYVRARLRTARRGHEVSAEIYRKQGSDVLTSTVWADGLVEIPEHATVAPGDTVLYYPFSGLLS